MPPSAGLYSKEVTRFHRFHVEFNRGSINPFLLKREGTETCQHVQPLKLEKLE